MINQKIKLIKNILELHIFLSFHSKYKKIQHDFFIYLSYNYSFSFTAKRTIFIYKKNSVLNSL